MDQFEQPLEHIFRDGIPAPVLRAFAPLYQAVPFVQQAVDAARDCYFWRSNPLKCIEQDVTVVTRFQQASETSFRLCPQQSATLLKCHLTEPISSLFYCRDEEWEWRTCLADKTGVHFAPYANAPSYAPFSNGGQTEDYHIEDRFYGENFSWWRRKAALTAVRERELMNAHHREHWVPSATSEGANISPHGIRADRV